MKFGTLWGLYNIKKIMGVSEKKKLDIFWEFLPLYPKENCLGT